MRRQDLLEHSIRIALGGIVDIGVIQQLLNTQQDLETSVSASRTPVEVEGPYLFDRDCGLPTFLLIQDGQTDGTGRIDVRVKECRSEFT